MPLDEAKDELLRSAAEMCAHTPGSDHVSDEEALAFLRLYYRHVAPEDLLSRNPVDVYGPAMAQRQLAENRPQGTRRWCGPTRRPWRSTAGTRATRSSRWSPTTCPSWSTR